MQTSNGGVTSCNLQWQAFVSISAMGGAGNRRLSMAAGAICGDDWLYYNFSCESRPLAALHINHKEALTVCLAAERWAPSWANRHVVAFSDNPAAVSIINKGSTGNP